MASLSKRPATSSAHELRDIKRHVLRERHRRSKSLSMTNLADSITQELFDSNGEKCSPRKKVGHGTNSEGVYEIEYDDNIELNQDKKVVKIIDILSQSNRKDFTEEIKVLQKSNHPQIVKYFGTARNHPSQDAKNSEIGIILEYCENGDLYNHLKVMNANNDILDDNLMKKWCNNCITAIQYLHRHKIIHRDIKSLNYLVNTQRDIKLSDFGKARENTAFNRDTTLRRLRTSPCWTAPELCNWDDNEIEQCSSMYSATYSSDIFALTIVLWEIIYYYYHEKYRVPYSGSIYEIYNKISNNKRPKVDKLFSRNCRHFLRRGWNIDRDVRPTASKMVDDFNELRF